jgi:histidine ammonia-lyase
VRALVGPLAGDRPLAADIERLAQAVSTGELVHGIL